MVHWHHMKNKNGRPMYSLPVFPDAICTIDWLHKLTTSTLLGKTSQTALAEAISALIRRR